MYRDPLAGPIPDNTRNYQYELMLAYRQMTDVYQIHIRF